MPTTLMMRSLKLSFSLSIISVAALACSEMDSRPERAEKLKPILVEVNPPVSEGAPFEPALIGNEVRLAFHFIAPPRTQGFTATPEMAGPKPLTVPAPLPELDGPVVVSELPGLQHSIVKTKVLLPGLAELEAIDPALAAAPFIRFQYQLRLSHEGRDLPLAGDFVAYRDASVPEASWNFQGSRITQPESSNSRGNKVEIAAEVVNQQGEPLRVAWFVSDGKIENRRASSTEWEAPGPGEYTLIFTVRGKQSRTGTLAIKSLTLE